MMEKGKILIICILSLVSGGSAAAQGAPPAASIVSPVDYEKYIPPSDASVFKFDYGVPSSPALTLLGIAESKVTQSNSLKPFVFNVLPGFLSGEKSDQAVSLDVAPAYYIVPTSQQKFSEYNGFRPALFRTRLSMAGYNGVNVEDAKLDKPSRLALGLNSSLLNSSDPLLASFPGQDKSAFIQCLDTSNSIADAALEKIANLPVSATEADRMAIWNDPVTGAGQVLDACKAASDMAARLGDDLDLGVGSVWEGSAGKLEHFDDRVTVAWVSYRRTIGVDGPSDLTDWRKMKDWADSIDQWFMIGGSVRSSWNETVTTGRDAKPQIKADRLSAWVGLERYTKTSRMSAEVGRERIDPKAKTDEEFEGSRTRWMISLDQQLSFGLWATLSYGEAEGKGFLNHDKTARISLKLAEPAVANLFGGL